MSHRLRNSTSPYLLQHAENPVDWYPWGEEALEAARRTDRPIFLSIGYAACHWCHVMAHESFEEEATAAQLNADFVCIKVDREERPDLDAVYMQAVVGMTGSGGWPLSVFLTPAGEPFFGGTYWPPTPRHGLPAFRQVLQRVADAWREQRQALLEAGGGVARALRDQAAAPTGALELEPRLAQASLRLLQAYDWRHGGWGGAPKFPSPLPIDFLLTRADTRGDRLARDQAVHALTCMAEGGIHDQIAGGFHRYAVDGTWTVPHFEKMLYDNALLARAYLHAWQLTGESRFRHIAMRTFDFMLRELRHPAGGLFASLDADSDGAEGAYYVWAPDQARAALGDFPEADFALQALSLTPDGNFEGVTVLRRPADLAEQAARHAIQADQVEAILERAGRRLLAARQGRNRPACDDKIVAEWNGLALVALAEAARATGETRLRTAASDLSHFLQATMVQDQRVARTWRDGRLGPPGLLADHAAVALGFLSQYQCDFDLRWYEQAELLGESLLERFGDPADGLYDTPEDHEQLIARPRGLQDSPTPSGNALACQLFLQLDAYAGGPRWRAAAEALLAHAAALASQHPTAFASWLTAAETAVHAPRQLAIIGHPTDPALAQLAQVAWARFEPHLCLAAGMGSRPELLRDRPMLAGVPTAYLCTNFACRLPTSDPAELARQLNEARQRGDPPAPGSDG